LGFKVEGDKFDQIRVLGMYMSNIEKKGPKGETDQCIIGQLS